MTKILAIAERDIQGWLNGFSFYLFGGFFLAMTGYFFWSDLSYFSLVSFQVATNPAMEVKGLNLTEGVLGLFLANVAFLLLILIPLLTMRSFAEDKRLGTLELLFVYPLSDVQIVIGKFLSLLSLLFLLILPTLIYFLFASAVGAKFEIPSILGGYAGLFLVAASFTALGMFMSSITEHQAVSAGIGFAILLFFWIVGWMADWSSPALGAIFRELSLVEHFRDFTRGVVDTKDVIYFCLFIGFFLLSTLCTLEVRSWKR